MTHPVTRPVVALSRRLPVAAHRMLAGAADVRTPDVDRPLTAAELHAAVAGADAVVCLLLDRVDEDLLDAAGPQLQVVATVAVGHDNIDVEACRRRGVRVTNTPDVLTDATADLTLALLLGITRRVGEGERLLRAGTPWRWDLDLLLGTGLRGQQLGLVGFGAIGRAVAVRAAAFGMSIAYTARHGAPDDVAGPLGARRLPLPELLAGSDVVSLHCPLTPDTHHLVDAAALRAMRRSAHLVNTARGPVVDESALVAALDAGEIRGAALDVFEHEPTVHPGLLGRDDVLITPHLGSATEQTREAMAVLAARNVVAVLTGQDPPTPVV
jgi:glyoxylate reductase